MGSDSIRISLSEGSHDREVSEIRVDGVIDTLTASELEEVFDSLIRRGRFKIIVDLAGVDYISSAGWGIFISHIKDLRDNDGDVKLANMIADVREIFELLEFDKVLHACSSVEDAVHRFSGSAKPGAKKKSSETRVEVVDDFATPSVLPPPTQPATSLSAGEISLEHFALRMLKSDPFVTIAEIRRDYAQQSHGKRAGWWRVFSILKRHRLLRRRSRFRYAWGRT
jgi:anti-sigma B factor antagonist